MKYKMVCVSSLWLEDVGPTLPKEFFTIHMLGNFFTSASTCPTSPLVTDNTPPVFCHFQLRTSNRWFTRPSPLSHFAVGPRTHISSVRCFAFWLGDECVITFAIMLLLIDIRKVLDLRHVTKIMSNSICICIVTDGMSGPRSVPSDSLSLLF